MHTLSKFPTCTQLIKVARSTSGIITFIVAAGIVTSLVSSSIMLIWVPYTIVFYIPDTLKL